MTKKGIIVDISKDLYFVKSNGNRYVSKARGVFRNKKLIPMVGDNVLIDVFEDNKAYIVDVLERKNEILRPPVANIQQAIVVVSLKEPEISFRIIDRYLMYYEVKKIPIVLCLNKCDLIDEDVKKHFKNLYESLGYTVILNGLDGIQSTSFERICKDKISVITGPSGVGKSTILNSLNSDYDIWVGEISSKTKRGKHTTRSATLYEIYDNSFVIDTAGFTSLDITKFIENEVEIREGFVEFANNGKCKFANCMHINEPDCNIKKEINFGNIYQSRYDSYVFYLNEYKKNRRY